MGDQLTRFKGDNVTLPARSSPYGGSRLAPAIDIVDVAKQIAEADRVIGTVVNAKLEVIAEQIRHLQAQARDVLQQALDDAEMHRASCRFLKKVGETYFLYRHDDGGAYFSMLSPEDWKGKPPHEFVGAYRLEADMSWSPASEAKPPTQEMLLALAGIAD
jgi:hypothetical protein